MYIILKQKLKKNRKKNIFMKRIIRSKVPFHSTSNKTWKILSLCIFSLIFSTIIVLPTMIVLFPKPTVAPVIAEIEGLSQVESEEETDMPSLPVTVKRNKTGEVEKLPLEEYIISVVAAEMPAEFEIEALKAQAIAARTYLVNHLLRHTDEHDLVISDTTNHQVYKNKEELQLTWGKDYHWKMKKIKQAVDETKNKIITYESKPITPTFFSMSNGYTEDAENYWGTSLPYLKSVESKWEMNHPNFTEQNIISTQAISQKLDIQLSNHTSIPIQIKRTKSNRVEEITIDGHKFTGRDVREKLGLRSNDFTIKQKNNHLIFTTKGYGHGVGMSQYGANGMAIEGKNYEEILKYYYQNVEISTISEAAPTLVSKHTN